MYSGNQNKQTINLMVKQSEKQANTQTDGRTATKPIPPQQNLPSALINIYLILI